MNVLWASQLTVEWLWTTTWQASLLALFVLGIQRLFAERLAPEWRYFLWWFVALRLVLPAPIPAAWSAFNLLPTPSLQSPLAEARLSSVREESAAPVPASSLPSAGFTLEAQVQSVAPPARRWGVLEFVAVLWLGGAFIAGLRLWRAHRRLAGIVRRGSPNTCPRVGEVLRDCVALMRLHRAPPVVMLSGFEGPALVGCLRPALVLPAELAAVLSDAELRHIFLHELAHLRRRDHVLNYVVCLLEVVHWPNPLLRQTFRRLRADRELACDALALSRLPAAQRCSYGATLLKLLQTASPSPNLPHLVGILEDKHLIQRRIRMIARPSTHSNRMLAWLTTGMLGFLTLTGAQTPVQGGSEDPSPITRALADSTADKGSSTSIKQEREIDKRNLQTIYQAILAYYRDNKDLPNWLSDLVPKYLPDAGVLVSPVEKRTGNAVLFGREDPKIHTSYIYEFNAAPAPEEFNIGREVPLTCKQWKLMQMGKFGMVTPILRAHGSQPVLNVAYSGDIYETGLLWENDPNTRRLVKNKPELRPQSSQNAQGPSVSILVVDANDKPIPGALIRHGLGTEFGLLPSGELESDANGKAVLSLGEWKANFLFLTASHSSYFTKGMEWNRKTSGEEAPPAELKLQLATKE